VRREEDSDMTRRTLVGAALLVLAQGLSSACSGTTPLAPSPLPPPQAAIAPTPQAVPSGYSAGYTLTASSLSGVVFDVTASGRSPIEGVTVYCDACGPFGHTWATTDRDGQYGFGGEVASGGGIWLSNALTPINVSKEGYSDPDGLPHLTMTVRNTAGWRELRVAGDTRFDIELVRR
jgi:hypothetical protein